MSIIWLRDLMFLREACFKGSWKLGLFYASAAKNKAHPHTIQPATEADSNRGKTLYYYYYNISRPLELRLLNLTESVIRLRMTRVYMVSVNKANKCPKIFPGRNTQLLIKLSALGWN